MNLQQRIDLLGTLGSYMQSGEADWQEAKHKAFIQNNWFIADFTNQATHSIATQFLQKEHLQKWAAHYHLDDNVKPRNVGIVMAGNIPLVGFHDFLSVFISGHRATIKLSSKDDVLLPHLVKKLIQWAPELEKTITFADMLKGCDAYIATGSNNSSRYFDYYFGQYPSIIRRNRTSVGILTGSETPAELEHLADDIQLYFGLGCRNITKIYVPRNYDFIPLLGALRKYDYFFAHNKYKNNYDYQLAIYLMNNQYYMTNDSIVLVENNQRFSPIGTLYYEFYDDAPTVTGNLAQNTEVQCIVGQGNIPFGQAQSPSLMDYADGVDIIQFLLGL